MGERLRPFLLQHSPLQNGRQLHRAVLSSSGLQSRNIIPCGNRVIVPQSTRRSLWLQLTQQLHSSSYRFPRRRNHVLPACTLAPSLLTCSVSNSTSVSPAVEHEPLIVQYEHGLPCVRIPLPSRQESCLFTLRPLTDNVGSLCRSLQVEDKGIDFAAIFTNDNTRISSSTAVEHLLQFESFRLRVNDQLFDVVVQKQPVTEDEAVGVKKLDDLRERVSSLHAALCIDEFKVAREQSLQLMLEEAENELRPLEQEKQRLAAECDAQSERFVWALFAAMGVQTGLFARLTWWEYSWDIMEPVTYFATYATVVASAAYYLQTKQTFEYPAMKSRFFTKAFYKKAAAANFDVEKYLQLSNRVDRLRAELRRLRDPLFHHLPLPRLQELLEKEANKME